MSEQVKERNRQRVIKSENIFSGKHTNPNERHSEAFIHPRSDISHKYTPLTIIVLFLYETVIIIIIYGHDKNV